jgi:hypothetical protein
MNSLAAGAALLVLMGCGNGGDDGGSEACSAEGLQVPEVGGSWLVAELTLTSSNCSGEVDDIIQDAIARSNECLFQVSQDNARVMAIDCGDQAWQGCVNESGDVTIGNRESESELFCTVTVDGQISANLTNSPTTGTLSLEVDFSGTCAFEDDCEAVVEGMVTEQVENGS